MTAETCSDCPAPATRDAYAGRWKAFGQIWVDLTRPLCEKCEARDVQERAEKRAS